MTKTIVILSDIQAPYEDRKALKRVVDFVGEYQPDELVQIGDLADYPQPSRWSKGSAAEFQGSVFDDSDYIKRNVLQPIRNVYDGPFGILEGNHDERPRKYLTQYAPALAEAKTFHFENLLDFDSFGVDKLPHFYEFHDDWLITHGHLGGIRLTQEAGKTALGAAVNKFNRSVIMGHTHRLGKMTKTYGYQGEMHKLLSGVEVGNLMDMRQAGYLKGGTANWQQGFCVLHIDGPHVHVQDVPIISRRFTVDGVAYSF